MILHIVLNDFTNDSRVLKETHSISNALSDQELWIAALKSFTSKEREDIGDHRYVWRVPLTTRPLPKDLLSQTLKYVEWILRIVLRFVQFRPRVVHCHDLDALPIGVAFKVLCGSRVMYDAHEYETELHGSHGLRKTLAKISERFLIEFVDHTITVSDSIANEYVRLYSITRPVVVRNIPSNSLGGIDDSGVLRKKLGISDDALIFIYQGGIGGGRGIETLLEVFRNLDGNRKLVFMGNGELVKRVQIAADNSDSIVHLPAVPPEDVLAHTRGANVGFSLIEDSCLSYRYSLPNKLFEFLKAGLPVIVNNLPDQRQLVEKYKCGWVVDAERDVASVHRLVQTLSSDDIAKMAHGAAAAAEDLDWEQEIAPVVDWYESELRYRYGHLTSIGAKF